MTINQIIKYVVWTIVGIFGLSVILSSTTTVQQGNVGIYLNMGKANGDYLAPGFHFKTPFTTKIKQMPVTTFLYNSGDMNLRSKDGQHVTTKVTATVHVSPVFAVKLYSKLSSVDPGKIAAILVRPVISGISGQTFAHYNIDDLVAKRDDLRNETAIDVKNQLSSDGLILDDLNIVSFNFSDEYNTNIEQKMAAEQARITAKLVLDKETTQSQIKVVNAKADADAAIAKATGDARATIINAEANANAIKVKNQAMIGASSLLIQYEAITHWDGVLPTYMTGDGTVPFVNIPTPTHQ